MSKNIFNVLATNDDSDDDRRPKTKPQTTAPKKDNKPVAQAHGNQGDKYNRDGPKVKDNYGPGEKRPYDRHSGTGRPAHKKDDYKKGGHGKGNVGTQEDNRKAEQVNAEGETTEVTETPVIVKLPEEEMVTLDDYISNTGATFGIKGEQGVKNRDPKTFEDANTKAIVSKKEKNQADAIKKPVKTQEKKQTKNVVAVEVGEQKRRNDRQGDRKGYVKYDKNEFPSL